MSDNKKYYYIKLKENFYSDDTIVILEGMPDGYLYSNILLKLYLKSIKNNGKLILNEYIPYSPTMLAQITGHNVGTMEKALTIFKQLGLIEVLDNGTIYMLDIQNFIGQSSTEADRKRKYRAKIQQEKLLPPNNKETEMQENGTFVPEMSGQTYTRDKSVEIRDKDKNIEESKYSDKSSYLSSSSGNHPKESSPEVPQKPIFIEFPLLGGKSVGITCEWVEEMQKLYGQGGVDVKFEIQRAKNWCINNKKFKTLWAKFLTNWFDNCVSRGGSKTGPIVDEDEESKKRRILEEVKEKEDREFQELLAELKAGIPEEA